MLWLAPAGLWGGSETGGVPPKPPATIRLSLCCFRCSGTSVRSTFWRCGVPLAGCCGSGNPDLSRLCGVPVASCCGRANPNLSRCCGVLGADSCGSSKLTSATLRRHSVSAGAAQTRSRLGEARSWESSLVGERSWPSKAHRNAISWCLQRSWRADDQNDDLSPLGPKQRVINLTVSLGFCFFLRE